MRFDHVFRHAAGRLWFPWRGQLALGVLLALFGVLILLYPMILVALVASVIFTAGVVLAVTALKLRRVEKQIRRGFPFDAF